MAPTSIRIVVLDGYALNPGDLRWEPVHEVGNCVIYDRTSPAYVVERASMAEAILINKVAITREVLRNLPRLRYIGVLATGYNGIDIVAAKGQGIVVTNVPEYGTASVAQMVFAHLLYHTQAVAQHGQSVREGRWSASPDWCYWEKPLLELQGLTMGIVGYGRIGRQVAAIARAFGMKVIAADVQQPRVMMVGDTEMVETDDLFRRADVVSLHCPLTAEATNLVDRRRLSLMKSSAVLINTSRGGLVDSHALAEALEMGRIGGAGLDVLDEEPPAKGHSLLHVRNCSLTPHIAWATIAARRRLLDIAVDNLRAWAVDRPRNVVS